MHFPDFFTFFPQSLHIFAHFFTMRIFYASFCAFLPIFFRGRDDAFPPVQKRWKFSKNKSFSRRLKEIADIQLNLHFSVNEKSIVAPVPFWRQEIDKRMPLPQEAISFFWTGSPERQFLGLGLGGMRVCMCTGIAAGGNRQHRRGRLYAAAHCRREPQLGDGPPAGVSRGQALAPRCIMGGCLGEVAMVATWGENTQNV